MNQGNNHNSIITNKYNTQRYNMQIIINQKYKIQRGWYIKNNLHFKLTWK